MTLNRRALLQVVTGGLLTWPLPMLSGSGSDLLAECVNGPWRTETERIRDRYRSPEAILRFWGLEPGSTVVEISPGAGWWTAILAPFVARSGGRYIAFHDDLESPGLPAEGRAAREAFDRRFLTDPSFYGRIEIVPIGRDPGPAGAADLLLSSRNMHGLFLSGRLESALRSFNRLLRPGGTLAVEQHRAPDSAGFSQASNGYVSEAAVIEKASDAGFSLVARSDILANPLDTRDHPFGVWTLPPTLRSAPPGQPPNPAFDLTPYLQIGESDRMALKLMKSIS